MTRRRCGLFSGTATRSWPGVARNSPVNSRFHPDYLAEFTTDRGTYQVQICFGCGEAKVFGPGENVRLDINGAWKLSEVLRKYRKNRPEPADPDRDR